MFTVEQYSNSIFLSTDSEIHLQEIVSQTSDLETLTRSLSTEFSSATAPGQGKNRFWKFPNF